MRVCQIFLKDKIGKYLILRSTVSFILCHRYTCLVCVTVGEVLESVQIFNFSGGKKLSAFGISYQQFELGHINLFYYSYVDLTSPN